MSFPYDILGKFLPDNVTNIVAELSKKRQQQLVAQTPEPLQMIIIILNQGYPDDDVSEEEPENQQMLQIPQTSRVPPRGTVELRQNLDPLPRNGFQV